MQFYDDLVNLGYFQPYTITQAKKMSVNNEFVGKIFPFIEKVFPRIAEIQEVKGGLALICLEGRTFVTREQQVVSFGLIPLLKAEVISECKAKEIQNWFNKTNYRDNVIGEIFEHVTIENHKYTVYTYVGNFQRCLVLGLGHIQFN